MYIIIGKSQRSDGVRFTEAHAGDNLIIQVTLGIQNIDLPSKVVDIRGENLIVNIIYYNGKMLNLSAEDVEINIMLIRQNKSPIIWKNVNCKLLNENGQQFYQLTATSDGYENNRREAFRLFVGNNGIAQMGINENVLNVIVKDVSENGFSFVASVDTEMAVGKPVRIVFSDLDIMFSLMGIIVRKENIDKKKVIYGCKLSVKNNELTKYINSKQRQNISSGKGSNPASEMNKNDVNDTDNEKASKNNKAKRAEINRFNTTAQMKELFVNALQGERNETEEILAQGKEECKSAEENLETEKVMSSLNKEQRREAFKNSFVGKKV